MKVIVIADGIASNAPYIRLLEENQMKYILGAKPGDHKFLFDLANASEETTEYEILDDRGFLHQFRYINDIPLNKSNLDVRINFLEYMQTDPKGKEILFSWVTNIKISRNYSGLRASHCGSFGEPVPPDCSERRGLAVA